MENMCIRQMKIEDYDRVYALWKTIRGFGIRSIDDSRAGVERFIRRNPSTSIVAEKDGQIVGSILCGHDGRIRLLLPCMCGKKPQKARHWKGDGR